MSTETSLEFIELSQALREAKVIDGTVNVDGLRALHADLRVDTVAVGIQLRCFTDEEQRKVVEGRVKTQMEFICQRCLTPMVLPIHSEFRLCAMTAEESLKECPDRYEPLLVSDGSIDIKKLVREELVLNFPLVATHDTAKCAAPTSVAANTQRPFADLDKLLKKDN